MQDIIKKDDLNYKSKRGKTYNFSKYSLPTVSLRDIRKGHLSIEGPDNKQSNFANELKNFEKGIKGLEKKSFLNNIVLLFSTREKVLNSFKSRLLPIREPAREPEVATEPVKATEAIKAKSKRKISFLKLREEFLNKIKNEEKK